jgi:dephospho-CoA kinase
MDRDNVSEEDIIKRINRQMDEDAKMKLVILSLLMMNNN